MADATKSTTKSFSDLEREESVFILEIQHQTKQASYRIYVKVLCEKSSLFSFFSQSQYFPLGPQKRCFLSNTERLLFFAKKEVKAIKKIFIFFRIFGISEQKESGEKVLNNSKNVWEVAVFENYKEKFSSCSRVAETFLVAFIQCENRFLPCLKDSFRWLMLRRKESFLVQQQ